MVARFDSKLNKIQMLSIEDEKALCIQYKANPTKELADKIILSNWRYVAKVAHNYALRYNSDAHELFQEGLDGMIVALNKFDPAKCYNFPKARFSSYAKMWVQRHMQVYIVKNLSNVVNNHRDTYKLLFWKFDGNVIPAERCPHKDISMDAPNSLNTDDNGRQLDLGTLFFNEEHQPNFIYENAATSNTLRETINKVLSAFNERDQEIIKGRYMADDPLTLQELGDKMQVSRERVRQLEVRVMSKLKSLADSLNLKEYY